MGHIGYRVVLGTLVYCIYLYTFFIKKIAASKDATWSETFLRPKTIRRYQGLRCKKVEKDGKVVTSEQVVRPEVISRFQKILTSENGMAKKRCARFERAVWSKNV